MKVKELLEQLKKMPLDAEVLKSNSEGCSECNPEGMEHLSSLYSVEFKKEGDYPYNSKKNIVVL
jgi:hypothetical protein